MNKLIPAETIAAKIHVIREQRVLLGRDLAHLHEVETRALKQAVRKNLARFLEDFTFTLSREEFESWRSQIVISKADQQGLRHPPIAYTEQATLWNMDNVQTRTL